MLGPQKSLRIFGGMSRSGEQKVARSYLYSGAWIEGPHRYWLARVWDLSKPRYTFIGTNPSTADADKDDHTITKEVEFATRWGGGQILKVNLDPYRATDWKQIVPAAGLALSTQASVLSHALEGAYVVCAWGNIAVKAVGKETIAGALSLLHARRHRMLGQTLYRIGGLTKNGQPAHPLRLAYSTPLLPWVP
jgi:hypothetical protein